ncbi:MAG: peptidylprolyl isomerase, partial [Rhodospirillales bacterium]|nr:peptidylprolyl isomerase [Rhodospirillales bacterium]
WGQGSQGIAAIVNDDIISRFDLNSRIRFVIFSSGLPNNQESYQRLKGQVLTGLINEHLKLQEAKQRKIKISRQQIGAAIEDVEKRNKLPKGGLIRQFRQNKIDIFSYERQLESELAWNQIIRREASKSGLIDPKSIDQQISLIQENKGKPEYLVAEIYIPFDAAGTANEVKNLADRMKTQIRQGARFANLARSFSQSASAARGGNLGWVREDQLDPALADVVQNLERGELSAPAKGSDGYYLLQLQNKRIARGLPKGDAIVSLQQIFLPLGRDAKASAVQKKFKLARSAAAAAQNCQDMEILGNEIGATSSGRISDVRLSSIAPNLRKLAQKLKIKQASAPIRTEVGFLVIMVCNRKSSINEEGIRQRIAVSLLAQKAELVSRRLLRNLRQSAFIDIRQ